MGVAAHTCITGKPEVTNRPRPLAALMKRFPRMHRTIRKFSECGVVEKPKDACNEDLRGSVYVVVDPASYAPRGKMAGDSTSGGLCLGFVTQFCHTVKRVQITACLNSARCVPGLRKLAQNP
jgi:hypothetical protein